MYSTKAVEVSPRVKYRCNQGDRLDGIYQCGGSGWRLYMGNYQVTDLKTVEISDVMNIGHTGQVNRYKGGVLFCFCL